MKGELMENGRPTKYKEEYNKQVVKLCKLGATDAEIADFFGVCEATINNWKLEDNGFLESIKEGKIIADMNVVNSLYKKAIGYEQEAVKIFQFQGEKVIVPYTEKFQPDTTAIMAWLNNRRPGQFRNKQEVVNTNLNIEMTEEEADKILKEAGYNAE